MTKIGTGTTGLVVGNDSYKDDSANRPADGVINVQEYIALPVSAQTSFGASAGVAVTARGAILYVSAAETVSAANDTIILDGNAGKVQYLRNDSAGVVTVVPPSGGTIHGVSSYTVSASTSHVLYQFSGTIANALKGA